MTHPDFRRVRRAEVYKAGTRAASLERHPDGGVEFRYRQDYIESGGERIATTLPVSAAVLHTPAGALPPFFAGLLPEGHRLTVLRRAVKTSLDDELSLLLAVGSDVPGDVQIVPADHRPAETSPLVDTMSPAELDFAELADRVDPHGIPGVQRKASASMISMPLAAGFGRFILKLSQPEFPHLVENEAAHLRAAVRLEVPVARSRLVTDRNGEIGLLTERFDRVYGDEEWIRLPFEDANQVLGLPPAEKYRTDSVDVVAALAAAVSAPLVAIRNLYIQFVFAWLTGNGDLHAKNVGILRDLSGTWRIAPIYDIPCTLLYGDDSMALPIAGRDRNVRLRDWIAFAEQIGLPTRAAASARKLALRAADVDLDSLPFSGSPLNHTKKELRHRRHELAGGAD